MGIAALELLPPLQRLYAICPLIPPASFGKRGLQFYNTRGHKLRFLLGKKAQIVPVTGIALLQPESEISASAIKMG